MRNDLAELFCALADVEVISTSPETISTITEAISPGRVVISRRWQAFRNSDRFSSRRHHSTRSPVPQGAFSFICPEDGNGPRFLDTETALLSQRRLRRALVVSGDATAALTEATEKVEHEIDERVAGLYGL